MRKTQPHLQAALPRVTIAIPTLNRVNYLRGALESALAQTYPAIEIVVSNNASTDDTASYLASCMDPRLHVLHQLKLLSMVENWNACLAASTGEYLLLLSDDDVLEPDAIEGLVGGYLGSGEGYSVPGIVYCGGRIIDAEGAITRTFRHSPLREVARELIPAFFRAERDLWLCAILFRAADLRSGFSTEFQSFAPDSAAWMRIVIEHGDAVFVPRELVRYRVHQNATASVALAIWKDEITRLSRFAIERYQGRVGIDHEFSSRVDRAVSRLMIRTIPWRINQSLGKRKISAVREYARQIPVFLSFYGLPILLRGLVSLFLPKEVKLLIKRLRWYGSQV
jgi:glycosyltransferase involved in cell wall biosynthesis